MRGGLGLARVDDDDPSAALDHRLHPIANARCGQDTAVRYQRVGSHHHEQVGAGQIGDRDRRRNAVEQLAGHQPAMGVLGRRGIEVGAQTEAVDEKQHGHQMRVAEGPRVTEVPAHRTGAMPAVNGAEPLGDIVHRFVPGDFQEGAVRLSAHRRGDPVRVVDHLGERDALLAGEPRRHRVLLVGAQPHQPAVLDIGHHPAQRLADAAERGPALSRHRVSLRFGIRRAAAC